MTLYSFKGHYPVEQIDNNKGWYEVPAKPEAPEDKQVAWLNGEWVVRDPKPEDRPGFQWNWNHDAKGWVECVFPVADEVAVVVPSTDSLTLSSSLTLSDSLTI